MGSFGRLFNKKNDVGSAANQASALQTTGNTATAYKAAMDLFNSKRTAKALDRFEQLAKIEPSSASIQYMLGVCYVQRSVELTKDNDALAPLVKKSVAAFKTAADLARVHGGLTPEQLKYARLNARIGERIIERLAPSPPE